MFYVYILQSIKNHLYYIGSTKNIELRIEKHNKGYVPSTKNMRPWRLAFSQGYESQQLAKNIEYRLKKLKRRDYIEKIIEDKYIKMR